MRLDLYLVKNGMMTGRDRAKEKIRNGEVFVNGKACITPSFDISDADEVTLTGENYFSRGELKLNKAFDVFGVDCRGRICVDIGASTGGFTYSMLARGASEVYAVDVGRGQMRPELAADTRVHNLEGFNARELTVDDIGGERSPFIVMDVSFISQTLILPAAAACLADGGDMITLLKPQFENDGRHVKNGVVKDVSRHAEAMRKVSDTLENLGCSICAATLSPIKGGDGNTEYLLHIRKGICENRVDTADFFKNVLKIK